MGKLESMADFFTARVEGYEEHMLANVKGCKEGYAKMASLIPADTERLLDLGCGTGLELDAIFRRFPNISVTGIDLTQSMLDKLRKKYPHKQMDLICGDYFTVDFCKGKYDCAVSFETMHHFTGEKKRALYGKIYNALIPGGCYIECDYMVQTQEEEDHWFAESRRIRTEQGIPPEAFFHYDTPCTCKNQITMLKAAGFASVEQVFQQENTIMLLAAKHILP